ncbi:MAG: sigma 54-interacting transcriptional regulator [bacterium]|jgi:DNA-binding NtrC family response regulator
MTSSDPRMQPVLDLMRKAAECSANVLVEGESGVGKAYCARRIHEASARSEMAYDSIFCVPETRAGGEGRRILARLQAAERKWGSIYVRGVDLLDAVSQRMLLAYLDCREDRIASCRDQGSWARLIFSSQKDLLEESRSGRFLSQLYMRISVVRIRIPPLRQRDADIVPLARYFVGLYSKRESKRISKLSREAEAMLRRSAWDGNIHELKNVLNRAVVMANDGDSLGPRDLSLVLRRANT